jgi:hypothetical protein
MVHFMQIGIKYTSQYVAILPVPYSSVTSISYKTNIHNHYFRFISDITIVPLYLPYY